MSYKVHFFNQIDPVLFWDVNMNQLDIKNDSYYIIKRIMTHGDKRERDLLFDIYTNKQIKEVVEKTREMPCGLKQIWIEILQ